MVDCRKRRERHVTITDSPRNYDGGNILNNIAIYHRRTYHGNSNHNSFSACHPSISQHQEDFKEARREEGRQPLGAVALLFLKVHIQNGVNP